MLDAHPLAEVLTSMPGVGSAFPTPGHLAAYAGLAPVTRPLVQLRPRRTSTQGRQQAPQTRFFLATLAALSHPESRAYYDRKRAEGKHNAALSGSRLRRAAPPGGGRRRGEGPTGSRRCCAAPPRHPGAPTRTTPDHCVTCPMRT